MKKGFLILLLITTVSTTLIGCGEKSDKKKDEDNKAKVEEIVNNEEKGTFDEAIIKEIMDFSKLSSEEGQVLGSCGEDGKITEEEKVKIKESMKRLDQKAQEIKVINEKTTDKIFKENINKFVEAIEKGTKLFQEGLESDNQEKILQGKKEIYTAGDYLNKAGERVNEITE